MAALLTSISDLGIGPGHLKRSPLRSDIGGEPFRVTGMSRSIQLAHCGVHPRWGAAIDNRDGSLLDQSFGNRVTDSTGGAGDQRTPTFQL